MKENFFPPNQLVLFIIKTRRSTSAGRANPALPAKGIDWLRNPVFNKGTAFTEAERDALGLRGLLPPHIQTMEQQARRVMDQLPQQIQTIWSATSRSPVCRIAMKRSFTAWSWTTWKK